LPQAVHDTFSMLVEDAVRIGRHPHLSGWGWGQRDDDRIVDDVIDALDLEPLRGATC
jgi:iron complex transport system ATP-binding protein